MNLKIIVSSIIFFLGWVVSVNAQLSGASRVLGADYKYQELVVPGMSAALEVQHGPVSVGFEVAAPRGETGPAGYGGYTGYEQSVGKKLSITLQSGFMRLGISDAASQIIESAYMLPIQLGGKYFFNKSRSGLYTHISGGAHYMFSSGSSQTDKFGTSIRDESEKWSEIYLSGVFGMGYLFKENIDAGIRYILISANENNNAYGYLGVRLAYSFGSLE
jgi:hypothetical protein